MTMTSVSNLESRRDKTLYLPITIERRVEVSFFLYLRSDTVLCLESLETLCMFVPNQYEIKTINHTQSIANSKK